MSKPLPVWLILLRQASRSLGADVVAEVLGLDEEDVHSACAGTFRGDTEPIAKAAFQRWAGALERHESWVDARHQHFEEKRLGLL